MPHPRHGEMVETARTVIVEWSPELKEVILKGRRPSNGTLELEPVIKESFTFHDLRANSGSDARGRAGGKRSTRSR